MVTFEEKRPIMVSVIVQNSPDKDQSLLMGLDYSKDPNTDILTNKAISEYARRSMKNSFGKTIYLTILELDNFSMLIDKFGDPFGEEILSSTAKIVKDAVGSSGMVGRIGEQNILMVIEYHTDLTSLRELLRTIRINIEWTFQRICNDIHITCTMGAASYPNEGDCFEKVLEIAEQMLDLGKKKGKNRYIIFRPEIHGQTSELNQKVFTTDVIEELQHDKVGILQIMIEKYLIRQSITNESMFNHIGYGFGLHEILLVCKQGNIAYKWTPKGSINTVELIKPPVLSVHFLQNFNKNNCFLTSTHSDLDSFPELQLFLEKENAGQSFFYRFGDRNINPGYLIFMKDRHREPFSEYEQLAFAIIGKALECTIEKR